MGNISWTSPCIIIINQYVSCKTVNIHSVFFFLFFSFFAKVDDISIRVAKALLPPEDKLDKTYDDIETITHANINVTIPTEFDTRTAWPNCSEVIGKVWDQGTCQSCWVRCLDHYLSKVDRIFQLGKPGFLTYASGIQFSFLLF